MPFKQRDRYSCASIAVAHAHEWQGLKVTRRNVNVLKKVLGCTPNYGVHPDEYRKDLISFGYEPCGNTLRDLDRALDAGNAAIGQWDYRGKDAGHTALIYDRTRTRYYGFNIISGHPNWVPRKFFSRFSLDVHNFEWFLVRPLVFGDREYRAWHKRKVPR